MDSVILAGSTHGYPWAVCCGPRSAPDFTVFFWNLHLLPAEMISTAVHGLVSSFSPQWMFPLFPSERGIYGQLLKVAFLQVSDMNENA